MVVSVLPSVAGKRVLWFVLAAVLLAAIFEMHVSHAEDAPADVAGPNAPKDAAEDGTCAAGDSCQEGSAEARNEKAEEDADGPFVCDFVPGLDFYERLGVDRDADDRTLKKAYRKQSLKYHPDKVKGKAEEKDCSQSHFIAVTKAYETLSDADRRKKYDLFGDIEEQEGGAGGGGADPFDLFQQFFNQRGGGGGGGIHFEFSSGGMGGFGGGFQQFFYEEDEDPNEIDLSECVNMCIIQYHQAGYQGDLEVSSPAGMRGHMNARAYEIHAIACTHACKLKGFNFSPMASPNAQTPFQFLAKCIYIRMHLIAWANFPRLYVLPTFLWAGPLLRAVCRASRAGVRAWGGGLPAICSPRGRWGWRLWRRRGGFWGRGIWGGRTFQYSRAHDAWGRPGGREGGCRRWSTWRLWACGVR